MSTTDLATLKQSWPLPRVPRPIVIVGAGDIVNDAHLPAYRKAGLPVAGLFDLNSERARKTAGHFDVGCVYPSLEEAAAVDGAVFDLALPPAALCDVLRQLPPGAAVLMQKPMGNDLNHAKAIHKICQDRELRAAVNFQLRFSPMMLAIHDALARGLIGEVVDAEVRLNVRTPWESFPYLMEMERVEIQLHSIHYLDLMRWLIGEPARVYARTVAHPQFPQLSSTRSTIILDYGHLVRCALSINHNYPFGPRHESATVKIEGTAGAAVASLGVMLGYPEGQPDELEIVTESQPWTSVPLCGNWFPEAFAGPMANLQRFVAGEDEQLVTGVDDAARTMSVVEACYWSDQCMATQVPSW